MKHISEEKKIEDVSTNEEVFSTIILNTMPQGMDIVDKNFHIIYMNKTFLEIFGKESIGKKCFEVYRDDKTQCQDCPLKFPLSIGETKTLETSGVGGGRTFKISHTSMLLNEKKVVIEIFIDITEKKKFETELFKTQNQLESKSQTLLDLNKQLEAKVTELEKFNKLMIGRELKMIALKKRIKELEEKLSAKNLNSLS